MWRFSFFLLALLAMPASFPIWAQEWPTKVVKFVSPYPPGGSVDPLARILAAKLGESLKQQFIVENRTGASGIIGTDYVAKSAPDGDRKSTRLNSSHTVISYAVFCLKKKKKNQSTQNRRNMGRRHR